MAMILPTCGVTISRRNSFFSDFEVSVTDISLHPGQIRELAVEIPISSAVDERTPLGHARGGVVSPGADRRSDTSPSIPDTATRSGRRSSRHPRRPPSNSTAGARRDGGGRPPPPAPAGARRRRRPHRGAPAAAGFPPRRRARPPPVAAAARGAMGARPRRRQRQQRRRRVGQPPRAALPL